MGSVKLIPAGTARYSDGNSIADFSPLDSCHSRRSHHVHDRVYRSYEHILSPCPISVAIFICSTAAGTVAGIFFFGLPRLANPCGHLAKHWRPRNSSGILTGVWAVFAVGCGLVRTYHELCSLRLLLGIAESGVYPATLIFSRIGFPLRTGASQRVWLLLTGRPSFCIAVFGMGCWTIGIGG